MGFQWKILGKRTIQVPEEAEVVSQMVELRSLKLKWRKICVSFSRIPAQCSQFDSSLIGRFLWCKLALVLSLPFYRSQPKNLMREGKQVFQIRMALASTGAVERRSSWADILLNRVEVLVHRKRMSASLEMQTEEAMDCSSPSKIGPQLDEECLGKALIVDDDFCPLCIRDVQH